jgi:hypothetical protein
VAEEEGSGGKGLSGTIKLPVIGPAKKKVVFAVGGVAGAFVLWRYWQSSQAASEGVTGDSDGDGFADGGTIPSVSGAVSGDNSYGSGGGTTSGSSDSYGFSGTTNSQWTQYASTQLSAASDKWSYGDVLAALGAYLANKPLTSAQQQIVQAAIAAAGNPPEGTHPVIPGGDVPITVAPTGLKVVSTTTTTATLSWNPVAGAGYYRAYRSGASTNVGATDGTTITVSGLIPNTSYSFQVAADTTSGTPGPKSGAVTGKTKSVTLAKPTGVRVSSVTKSTAVGSCSKVAGATGYNWYINGIAHGHSDGPKYTVVSLRANTRYKLSVAADTASQGPGPQSGQVSFKTKAK